MSDITHQVKGWSVGNQCGILGLPSHISPCVFTRFECDTALPLPLLLLPLSAIIEHPSRHRRCRWLDERGWVSACFGSL
jgi:hypothetical protein